MSADGHDPAPAAPSAPHAAGPFQLPVQRDSSVLPPPAAHPSDVLDPVSAEVPTAAQCVLGPLLRRRAAGTPTAPYALMPDGEVWTYRRTLQETEETAAALQALGVAPGELVLSWLPNGPEALRTWYGVNMAGAVLVPLNIAYRGTILHQVIADSGAEVLICRPSLAARLTESAQPPGKVRTIVLLPGPDEAPDKVRALAEQLSRRFRVHTGLRADRGEFTEPVPAPQPWDPQTVIYTSGTTGPSKGVVSSYAHLYSSCTAAFHGMAGPEDRYLLQLPLFHAGGTIGAYGMLVYGASVTVVPAFTTSEFWPLIRRTGTTLCTLLGVMATYLLKQPAVPQDTGHPLRAAYVIPFTEGAREFAERFGVSVRALFNMTEVSCPVLSDPGHAPDVPMHCGRPRPGITARVVDDHDREVADGETGELILRADRPWAFNSGYLGRPQETAAAWRNGWFHTGDGFRRAPDGGLVFVDRKKDAIRRRGENISSFEVETQAVAHPEVLEAAAVAVPGDEGEDEVLLVVAGRTPAAPVPPEALLAFLRERLAHFMLPRYIRLLPELPKTPTGKPTKHTLRAEGVTEDTWDREAAGIRIRRERIV
ncbi:ATP-dependent acyl-CoA ligase [Streptomyces sp. NPDC058045]|uniref:ATP-dependent acyl-CoA ligase n=1 Tax=Streptomyces sp. NPDC058045 TaxID=3346311 RepID=UPI0036EAEDAB